MHFSVDVMALIEVSCKYCNGFNVVKYGSQSGHTRYRCKDCARTFQLTYTYQAYEPGVKEKIVSMAMNGSGVRDTARVLSIGKNTVLAHLKKSPRCVDD